MTFPPPVPQRSCGCPINEYHREGCPDAPEAPPSPFSEPDEWPDPILRERVARALSWHSDGGERDDYAYFRGYWLGAADMALQESGLAEVTAERDRLRKALEEIADHPANLPWPQKWTHWSGLAREALGVNRG